MKTGRLFLMAVSVLALFVFASDIFAEKTIAERIDSMFIIASSLDIKYRDQVEPARDSIAALGVEAVPHLIEMLGTPHGRERAALEEIFKKIGYPAVPLLNEALLTTDSLRLSRVGTILYYHPDTSSVENLLKVADNDFYSARYQIIRALGKIGDLRAVPAVRLAMKDTIELVRTIAAVSAGRLKDASLLPDLLAAFDDDYYGTRMSVHEALMQTDCEIKKKFIEENIPGCSMRGRLHLLTIIADDTCLYDLKTIRPFLDDPEPLVKSLALRAANRIDPEFVSDYVSNMPDNTDSFILRQTIEDLKQPNETETPSNP